MNIMGKVTAIVLAAGKGNRMHSEIPKQYLEVYNKPILYYALHSFEQSQVDNIVLVTRQEDIAYCKEQIIDKYGIQKVTDIVQGGEERYWSVYNGLKTCRETGYVLIHDSARPCIGIGRINEMIEEVVRIGACTFGVPVKDTIKVVNEDGYGIDTPPRRYLWQIQTPQAFIYKDLVRAYEKMREDCTTDITDDTMIVERYLHQNTKVIQGDYSNIKVTTPDDLDAVLNFFKKNKKSC